MVDEIKALKAAQEDEWVPNLKEVRIIRWRDTFDVAYLPSKEDEEMLRNLRNAAPVPV